MGELPIQWENKPASQSYESGMTVNERNPCERPELPRGGKSPGRAVRGDPSNQAEHSSLPMHIGVLSDQTEAAFDLTQQIIYSVEFSVHVGCSEFWSTQTGHQPFLTPDVWWTLVGVS